MNILNVKWFIQSVNPSYFLPLFCCSVLASESNSWIPAIAEDNKAKQGDAQKDNQPLDQSANDIRSQFFLDFQGKDVLRRPRPFLR